MDMGGFSKLFLIKQVHLRFTTVESLESHLWQCWNLLNHKCRHVPLSQPKTKDVESSCNNPRKALVIVAL
jgi:hypothetical protein